MFMEQMILYLPQQEILKQGKIKDKIVESEEDNRKEWQEYDITELDQNMVDEFVEKVVVWDERRVDIRWKFGKIEETIC